jgi:hypothetical protein
MPRRRPREPQPPVRRGRPPAAFDPEALSARLLGPEWAQAEGYRVRQSLNRDKRYRCPYCQGWVLPGTVHIVAFPEGRAEDRRHYHTPCWERQSGTRRPEP